MPKPDRGALKPGQVVEAHGAKWRLLRPVPWSSSNLWEAFQTGRPLPTRVRVIAPWDNGQPYMEETTTLAPRQRETVGLLRKLFGRWSKP